MQKSEWDKPDVSFSWFLREDSYTKEHCQTTLESAEGKNQLMNAIELCIDQGMEIRIWSDKTCLVLEANNSDSDEGKYVWIDGDHYVGSLDNSYTYNVEVI